MKSCIRTNLLYWVAVVSAIVIFFLPELSYAAGPRYRRVSSTNYVHTKKALDRQVRALQPTMVLDPDVSVSTDSENIRVDQIDSTVGAVSFTQSTDANKPLLSERGRYENLLPYSDDLDNGSVWFDVRATIATSGGDSGPGFGEVHTLTEDSSSNTHYHQSDSFDVISGVSYRGGFLVKANSRDDIGIRFSGAFGTNGAHFALDTGTAGSDLWGSTDATGIIDLGSGWYFAYVEKAAASTTTGVLQLFLMTNSSNSSYAGDGSSNVYMAGAVIQRASMNPTYIPTQSLARHGSLTGRRGLVFDGSNDYLTSTATNATIFDADAKSLLAVFEPYVINTYQNILSNSAGNYFTLRIMNTSNQLQAFNVDSSGIDYATSATLSAGVPTQAFVGHDGTNLTLKHSDNSTVSAASGDTTVLTSTLEIGGYGGANQIVNGQVVFITTFDKVLPSSTRQRLMQKFKRVYRIN